MFAICIEASHKKGMGHLSRMVSFTKYLINKNEEFIFFVNDFHKAQNILERENCRFEVVDFKELNKNLESDLIQKYRINFWINDRLNTHIQHAKRVVKERVKLVSFDDFGSGAKMCDLNVCGLCFDKRAIYGKKVLRGVEHLILNSDIQKYKRKRSKLNNILVTLGGSDTYGVTIKVLKLLKKFNIRATIHIGPFFEHLNALKQELTDDYELIDSIPSLVQEFQKYDLAITGGGITPFEANASGLPCLIIANELFEIPNGKFLDFLGSSKFLGYFQDFDETFFANIENQDIGQMSEIGLNTFDTKASEKIFEEITNL